MKKSQLKSLIREVIEEIGGVPKKPKLTKKPARMTGNPDSVDLFLGQDKIATIEDTGNECEFQVFPSGRAFRLSGDIDDVSEHLRDEAVYMPAIKRWGISVKKYLGKDYDIEDASAEGEEVPEEHEMDLGYTPSSEREVRENEMSDTPDLSPRIDEVIEISTRRV